MHVQILHLGYGNSKSLEYVLRRISDDFWIETLEGKYERRPKVLPKVLFLPGVGNFGLATDQIRNGNWDTYIRTLVDENVKIVGICLGMQLLGQRSEESPDSRGLALIPGEVRRLQNTDSRVPNVGWRSIQLAPGSPKNWSTSNHQKFYFTHSYYFHHFEEVNKLATTSHGTHEFASIVNSGSVYGFQFHIEKSGSNGLDLLRRVVREDGR